MTIYLKYGTWNAGTLTWSSSQSFNALSFTNVPSANRIEGNDLRDEVYNHLVSTRNIWKLIISCDELVNSTKKSFLLTFFKAHEWKFSLDNWTTETVVSIPTGDMQIENIEKNKNLVEVTLLLTQKVPD
jgi:hypothetical protein